MLLNAKTRLHRRSLLTGFALATATGCAKHSLFFKEEPPTPTALTSLVRDDLIIHSDFELSPRDPLWDELRRLKNQLASQLELPASEEIVHIYLYQSQADYEQLAQRYFPGAPRRRAFYVESPTRRNVHALWGEQVREDLRHETTHAFVHRAVVPPSLWLDEGLAEYMEVSPEGGGPHAEHIELLTHMEQQGWTPNLDRLERITLPSTMEQADYAEAWLWTHWLLGDDQRRELVRENLKQLRREGTTTPLSLSLRKLASNPHRDLLAHLHAFSRAD